MNDCEGGWQNSDGEVVGRKGKQMAQKECTVGGVLTKIGDRRLISRELGPSGTGEGKRGREAWLRVTSGRPGRQRTRHPLCGATSLGTNAKAGG